MNPIQHAAWYIESHFREALSLDDIAAISGVSPFHLTRAFAALSGLPLMQFVRRRRLSEAAKCLAAGAEDILSVALDHGYGSHEAFSRAFKDCFQLTPEQVRQRGSLADLQLTEALLMHNSDTGVVLKPPRLETRPEMQLAGLVSRYPCAAPLGIPDQWQRFRPWLERLEDFTHPTAYGVCYNFDADDHFDYLTATEVPASARLPFGLVALRLPAQTYAMFEHTGPVSEIRAVLASIWRTGLSEAGLTAVEGPMLEVYPPAFESTGHGGFGIWVPVQAP